MTPAERFWKKVDKTGECWLWTASCDQDGYGQFMLHGEKRRRVRAHRFAYEMLVGPIPEGLTIDHLCRVARCVNPAHLEPVTDRVNILRGVGLSAQNARKTHCPQGHAYDEANTYTLGPNDHRYCRACHVAHQRRYKASR